MGYSRIFCATALIVIGSLVSVSAGHYGGGSSNQGALTHYGGGKCQGRGCYNQAQMPMQASHSPYGPYHSYAVRPAVYGGHGLYTYKGYARHQPAPASQYRQTRSYGMAAPSRHYGSSCRGYNCNGGQRQYSAQPQMNSYNMKPHKAVALKQSSNNNHYNQNSPYSSAMPTYGQQQNRGHYRVARGAYGSGQGKPARYQKQSYGNSQATGSSHYGGSGYGAGNGNGAGRGYSGGNGGY